MLRRERSGAREASSALAPVGPWTRRRGGPAGVAALAFTALLSLSSCGARTVLDDGRDAGGAETSVSPSDRPSINSDVPSTILDIPTPPADIPLPPVDVPVDPVDVPFPPLDVPKPPVDVPFPPLDVPFPPLDIPTPPEDLPAPELRCESAQPIVTGTAVTVSGLMAGGILPACAGGSVVGGPVRWYRIEVPAGATLEAQQESGVLLLARAYTDCAAVPACLASNLGPLGSALRWTNATGVPRQVVLAFATAAGTVMASGTARVRVVQPTMNGVCANATPLAVGQVLTGTLSPSGETPMSCAGDPPPQPAQYYRVRVPAGQSLAVTYTPVGGFRAPVSVRLAGSCGGACVASSNVVVGGTSVIARWTNTARSDLDIVVAISPTSSTTALQDFTVTASLSTPPSNTSCGSATPVRDGTRLSAQDLTLATVIQPPCPGMTGAGGAALFYSAVVPRGQSLFVSATSELAGRVGPTVRVIPGCGSNVCLAASGAVGVTTGASYFNAGADQPVIIAVSATSPVFASPFTLAVAIRAPATNGTCRGALRVTNGASLVAQSLADGREPPTACAVPGRDANALYYAVRVGAGEQLIVTATRAEAGIAPSLRLFSACGDAACIAQSTPAGQTSRLSYTNATGAAQELLFSMNLQDGGANTAALANLSVSVSRPPYTVTTLGAACDAMLPATLPSLVGDDVGTESQPLPFGFSFFGLPVSAWSASTNGYLQLWPTSGRSAGALGQTELPASAAPPGMIAAFWDDLLVTPGVGDVRWGVVDAGGRHLTVQWTDAQFCCSPMGTDRLTFQVKLFAATGAVEMHYCQLSGSARVNGQAASIGMQDTAAVRGVSYAARRPDAVRTGFALRFTP